MIEVQVVFYDLRQGRGASSRKSTESILPQVPRLHDYVTVGYVEAGTGTCTHFLVSGVVRAVHWRGIPFLYSMEPGVVGVEITQPTHNVTIELADVSMKQVFPR